MRLWPCSQPRAELRVGALSELDLELVDRVALYPGVSLENTKRTLVDSTTGGCLILNSTGVEICEELREGATVSDVVDSLATNHAIPIGLASRDVTALVAELNLRGLLSIRSSWPARFTRLSLQARWFHLMEGELLRAPLARRPPTLFNLVIATAPTMISLILMSSAVAVLLITAGSAALGAANASTGLTTALPVIFALQFWAGLVAHEAGHLLATRLAKGATAFFWASRPTSVALRFGAATAREERAVLLTGPLSGIGACIVATFAVWVTASRLHAPTSIAVVAFFATVAPHVWSLSPWSADGKGIWRRER